MQNNNAQNAPSPSGTDLKVKPMLGMKNEYASGKMILMSRGKEFLTYDGKMIFMSHGKMFFISDGKQFFT